MASAPHPELSGRWLLFGSGVPATLGPVRVSLRTEASWHCTQSTGPARSPLWNRVNETSLGPNFPDKPGSGTGVEFRPFTLFRQEVCRDSLDQTCWLSSFCTQTLLGQGRPTPSLQQANQAETQSQKDIPPPANRRVTVDPAKLKHDADELASLAESVPPEVDQATKGVLPKDLSEKLKRIEKLAKQLRSQISQ
jgi:hypothetical protein